MMVPPAPELGPILERFDKALEIARRSKHTRGAYAGDLRTLTTELRRPIDGDFCRDLRVTELRAFVQRGRVAATRARRVSALQAFRRWARSAGLPCHQVMCQGLDRFAPQLGCLQMPALFARRSQHMSSLTIPASRVKQGILTLYATSIKVRDLISPGFYSVETLDPDDPNDKGFQRLLNTSRAKKLADYIVKGQDTGDAFLPTSVFLATDTSIPFDAENKTITFETGTIGSFSVVDGQHRLEGLRMAAEKDERVLEFEVPVNIAIQLPKIAQMCHFLIVNTTQRSVDKSVEQRIVARLTEALELEDMPSLPKWILNTVQKGEVDRAIKFVDFLNTHGESPWRDKIKMANPKSDSLATVNQRSFVKAIVKYVLTANNPLAAVMDLEKEKKIFLNYWKAIAQILDDGNAAVLFKYNGVELFCKFSIPFFMKLQDKGDYKVATMTTLLKQCFDNVEGEYAGVGHPEWWSSGSKASFLNAGAINVVSQELSKALNKSLTNVVIEV